MNQESGNQSQSASGDATAVQAGGNVTITKVGPTVDEVRQVALDVFRSNFFELAGEAKQIAKTRAEEITEAFLSKLQAENAAGLAKSQDPDFQYALFAVQRDYARTGDKDLGDLLVDLLVDRSKHDQRGILQIVLNESLVTAPKLTETQLAALSIAFLFRYTQNHGIVSHEILGAHLDRFVSPFVEKVPTNIAAYQHLEFSGCGSIGLPQSSLEDIFGHTYQGLFLKGFDERKIAERGIPNELLHHLVQCLNDSSRLQVNAINQEHLDKILETRGVSNDDRNKLKGLFDEAKMTSEEIKAKVTTVRPYMSKLFDAWSKSAIKNFTLTSVGIAIGHANIKRFAGEFSDLSIWIN